MDAIEKLEAGREVLFDLFCCESELRVPASLHHLYHLFVFVLRITNSRLERSLHGRYSEVHPQYPHLKDVTFLFPFILLLTFYKNK